MKAVLQRVDGAKLSVSGEERVSIGRGLVVYVGIEQSDVEADVVAFCRKVSAMRIFSDADGKMNLSALDIGADVLLVPNFTLCADISHGNRPSFVCAMRPPSAACALFDYCVDVMRDIFVFAGVRVNVASGVFGADMTIDQVNIGPVTIVY